MRYLPSAIVVLAISAPAWASDPPLVPLMRPEMKQLLEESKNYATRLKRARADSRRTRRGEGMRQRVRQCGEHPQSPAARAEETRLFLLGWAHPGDGYDRPAQSQIAADLSESLGHDGDREPHPRPDRPRPEHDAGLCLQDNVVLDRLARQQLHLLHGPSRSPAPGVRRVRGPDRRARRRLVRVHPFRARRVRRGAEADDLRHRPSPRPTSTRCAGTSRTSRCRRSSGSWRGSTR